MPTSFGGWVDGLDILPVAREGADGGEEAGIITGVLSVHWYSQTGQFGGWTFYGATNCQFGLELDRNALVIL